MRKFQAESQTKREDSIFGWIFFLIWLGIVGVVFVQINSHHWYYAAEQFAGK